MELFCIFTDSFSLKLKNIKLILVWNSVKKDQADFKLCFALISVYSLLNKILFMDMICPKYFSCFEELFKQYLDHNFLVPYFIKLHLLYLPSLFLCNRYSSCFFLSFKVLIDDIWVKDLFIFFIFHPVLILFYLESPIASYFFLVVFIYFFLFQFDPKNKHQNYKYLIILINFFFY